MYVTYDALFAFVIMLCTVIALAIKAGKKYFFHKKITPSTPCKVLTE